MLFSSLIRVNITLQMLLIQRLLCVHIQHISDSRSWIVYVQKSDFFTAEFVRV